MLQPDISIVPFFPDSVLGIAQGLDGQLSLWLLRSRVLWHLQKPWVSSIWQSLGKLGQLHLSIHVWSRTRTVVGEKLPYVSAFRCWSQDFTKETKRVLVDEADSSPCPYCAGNYAERRWIFVVMFLDRTWVVGCSSGLFLISHMICQGIVLYLTTFRHQRARTSRVRKCASYVLNSLMAFLLWVWVTMEALFALLGSFGYVGMSMLEAPDDGTEV